VLMALAADLNEGRAR